ncbi:hypothetical protein RUM43_009632 [Polyplax serrata]|uniref:AB hydrolase-1 domain-containing protein n=1 Tax=Polyplax serrata TaxID=468196 RepID=A0AAN8S9U3_POLSC
MAEINEKYVVKEVKIKVPWGEIALKCWNLAELPAVLVVHGLCENAGSFDRLIPLLSRQFFYVVIDLPGHGRSSRFPQGLPLDFMVYVGQLERVITHFKWKKLSLMGHSLGAHILEFFAATYTNKVEKLILIDAISPTPVPSEVFLVFHRNEMNDVIELEEVNRKPTSYTYEEAFLQVASKRMSTLTREAGKPVLDRSLQESNGKFVFTTDPRIRREIKPAIGQDVILDQIKRIKCPVLVILAKDSEQFWLLNSPGFYTRVLDILKRTHSRSAVVRVVGNHCVHNNQPEIIAPIVNGFLLDTRGNSKF